MNNTQTNFFKQTNQTNFSHRDEKNSTSYDKNRFKTNTKSGTSNWPKIKDLTGENKIDFRKTNQKFNPRGSYKGDPVN